jgi:hypothetical protein
MAVAPNSAVWRYEGKLAANGSRSFKVVVPRDNTRPEQSVEASLSGGSPEGGNPVLAAIMQMVDGQVSGGSTGGEIVIEVE